MGTRPDQREFLDQKVVLYAEKIQEIKSRTADYSYK